MLKKQDHRLQCIDFLPIRTFYKNMKLTLHFEYKVLFFFLDQEYKVLQIDGGFAILHTMSWLRYFECKFILCKDLDQVVTLILRFRCTPQVYNATMEKRLSPVNK